MKKFFKILRKIIKIFLKSILRLILGIIVIVGIVLVIINNRTLKFYENDNGNMKFIMKESFIIENGTEFKLKIKDLGAKIKIFENGYVNSEGFIKINLPNISFIEYLFKNGYIDIFSDIIEYCFDSNLTLYYDNGQIEKKGQLINGINGGYNIKYYINGQISDEINFKLGTFTGYYKNGNIKYNGFADFTDNNLYYKNLNITGYYDNGNINYTNNNGYYVDYYNNGNIHFEGNFVDGNITGYYDNGEIYWTGLFEYNHWNNTYFDEYGKILGTGSSLLFQKNSEITLYDDFGKFYNYVNKGYFVDYHNNGQLKSIGNYEGILTGYYDNGNIRIILNSLSGDYIDGKLIESYHLGNGKYGILGDSLSGDIIIYSINGNIIENFNLNNGFHTYYDENGNFLGTGIRVDRLYYDGLYINYSQKNGQILEKGNYVKGEKNGYRVEYFDDGQIYSEGNYNNGKRVGVWNRYLGDGSIGVSKDYGGTEKF